ncbi:mastermind-like protein 2 [Brachionichthys hirsutus]|uniref:mastermind-like protein 2 n=1 Tax=Brachionichthys hirsutus TaxID=412623 RepID=UPI00360525FA
MGEATPAQSSAGPFVPMLGVGLGPLPGGPVAATSRGSAVPHLHSAIVERLRARIELCRRHHSTCENRYQRGQAESSDREHENTLHLLNIVQQGPGSRKAKTGRGSNPQQPEYSRANGEHNGREGEQKISTRIALQGSLRRKIEGHGPGQAPKQNGHSCGFSESDFKRVRVDTSGLGQGPCHHNAAQSHSAQGSSAMVLQHKNYMMPHGVGSDIFNMTLKEMKKEPSEVHSCGQSNTEVIFDFKDEGGGQIDPELQDLFDELTKTVPTLNDLEFERMLKQDDAFGLDMGRPSSAGATAALPSPLERPIKIEPCSDFAQVPGGLPQLRPASAGPSFTLTGASSTNLSQKANVQAGQPRAMPCWPEISHAEQLKQMAANQQQPNPLLHHHHHHHHQASPPGLSSWTPAISSQPSTSTFSEDKVSSPPSLSQQRLGSQSKGINNCLYKSNDHNGSHHLDILSTKPTLHFSPKAPHSVSQPMPIMTSTVNKASPQQQQQQQPHQPSLTGQSQPHSALHFQNQQISTSGVHCLQQKLGHAALPYKLSQQRQGVAPGPRLPTTGSLGVMSQPRPPAPNNQQKGAAKTQAMQRQLIQQQHTISDSGKDGTQDQFSRHLTRPPPEYKHSRNVVRVHLFGGQISQTSSNNSENHQQSIPCLSSRLSSKMSSSLSDRRFGIGTDYHPSPCVSHCQQHNNPNRILLSQNKSRFPAPNQHGNSFEMNNATGVPHPRATSDLHSSGAPGQGLGGLMRNANMGWSSAKKQATTGLAVRQISNPLQSQGMQLEMPNNLYQQRHVGPPNQVAPDIGMLPQSPSVRDTGPRPMMGSPAAVGNLHQTSPEQRLSAGNFAESSPGSSSYHNSRASRLTFDFLPEGDNTVPGINTDSDFIDSLLKSGSGNDDWMKDINLDEILGSHS